MPKYLTLNEAFLKCKKQGKLIPIAETNPESIKSTTKIAEGDMEAAKILISNKSNWNSIYKLYYDALHELVEAFLRFDNIKSNNHQCLFSYICQKHPELELDWDFFETIRTKRNGINYYGTPVTQKDWKEVELQFNLYAKKLKEEIQGKLS